MAVRSSIPIVLTAAILIMAQGVWSVGTATVINNCPQKICVYTTTPGGGSITHIYKLKRSKTVTVPYPANGMLGSQVRVSPNCDPTNIVYWEFAQGNSVIYYDVNINGPTSDPFALGLSVTGTTLACPTISCAADGSTTCFNYPNGHQQNQVKACLATNSIYFNACTP